jgi:hypothetical protein
MSGLLLLLLLLLLYREYDDSKSNAVCSIKQQVST